MPKITRRSLAALGLAGLPGAAIGQGAWPGDRPISFIIPFPPGGGTDVMARAMVPHLERHLPGARFVPLNRPGAGAEVGYTALAAAPPDGLTLGVVIVPSLQTITIERTPRYRLGDFAFLGSVVDDPGGFFVAPDSPLQSLADLAAHARANPDKVAVGTAGIGSDDHLLMIGFESLLGTRLVHVPFAGQAPTVAALLGRHITVAAMNIGESLELVKQGQARPLAQAAPSRTGLAPDIPTFREQGFALEGGVVRGLAVPAATPAPIRARLEAALLATMDDPAWQADAARLYQPLRRMDGAGFTTLVQEEAERLKRLWHDRPWKD
ncbi:tripartite tricarboxylate transporter substrate binding protein [Belnapia sp. T6]|uniref:Tripartite tricarboxylate transporter substrate binding protein n=1 Tax=Belnapia mucosa TaxID=2804532 RepID=A0ABS1V7F7_9PROT|nr:tripartite tricarboxylate transporter substrate binding protein [Belnapia mucosa]MBL6457603.1 tripartite tricarboxylate transporter substrate binding protein [Belnapia mucosa]